MNRNAYRYNCVPLFLGEINAGTWASRYRSHKIEAERYDYSSRWTRTRERLLWPGLATIVSYRPDLASNITKLATV
jgi:hypothetical protein